ncbi:winged helix DNA-binding domain-containing protein, partial [Nocardioides albidus]
MEPAAMVGHLVGLQAQEPLPPYLSLAARLTEVDPHAVSAAIEDRSLVRVLSLRDTVHLHLPADAVTLPVWAAPVREREIRASQTIGPAREVDRTAFSAAVHEILADGPLPQRQLGA